MKSIYLIFALFISTTICAQEKQSVVTLKNGTELTGVIKAIDPTDAMTLVIGGVETSIKMADVAKVGEANAIISGATPSEEGSRLKDFKGFLLAKGNNVYVNYRNSENDEFARYDREGAKTIIELLKEDGFWNVVDDANNAHFVFTYIVDTTKSDKAILKLSSNLVDAVVKLASKDTNESVSENKRLAAKFYKNYIKSLQKKIEENKHSTGFIDDFTVK